MKKETKELISFIKHNCVQTINDDDFYKKWKEAMKFLDSLPEIEEKLCFGGYIQDKNGTPCCQGDKVKYKDIPVDKVGAGTLRWNVDKSRFEIYWKDEDLKGLVDTMNIKTDFAPRDIEKVENYD